MERLQYLLDAPCKEDTTHRPLQGQPQKLRQSPKTPYACRGKASTTWMPRLLVLRNQYQELQQVAKGSQRYVLQQELVKGLALWNLTLRCCM